MDKDLYPVRLLVSLLIDYFRWTQLVPMILVWSMIVAMSFVLLLAYNEDAAWSFVELCITTIQSLPFIGERFDNWMESQTVNGVFSPDLGAVDFRAFVLSAWAWSSFAFMLLSGLLGRVIRPLPPFTLKHKLTIAGAASAVFIAAFSMLIFFDQGGWKGAFIATLASAGGMGMVLFIISAWCLSVSHGLGIISDAVMDPNFTLHQTGTVSKP